MNSVLGIKDCYGCGVCAVSCKLGAISMELDSDGFLRPSVDRSRCVNCGVCVSVCSFKDNEIELDTSFDKEYYAGWSLDKKIRHECSSGGVGYEIERHLLNRGYYAIVCGYNYRSQRAEHYIAFTEEDLKLSIGSKYIQSYTFSGFSRLTKGQQYVVVGTPCQIDSIRRWARRMNIESDLVLIDFFCHGVPSMLMWNKYLKEVEAKIGTFDHIAWRDKQTGWHDSWVMKVGNRYCSWYSHGDLFYRMFLKNRCLAKPCYFNCKYKGESSSADIRIGDLWGKKYAHDDEGVNGVVCVTTKGKDIIREMKDVLCLEPSTKGIVCESQMSKCAHLPLSYKLVMKGLHSSMNLRSIDLMAQIIELIDDLPGRIKYYALRLPEKIKEFLN